MPVIAGVVPVHGSFRLALPASIGRSLWIPHHAAFQAAPVRQSGARLIRSFDLVSEAIGTRARRDGNGGRLTHRDRLPS